MKKFSKLFLSCAAVAAVTAAVATSAMAAGGISATYTAAGENETTAKLTIDASGYTADQKTLLIVPSSVSLDKVTAGDVVQIDQNAEIVDVVLPADLKDGTYTVYMGGDGQVYSDTFRVGAGKVLIGDADQDGFVDGGDATTILKYNVGSVELVGDGQAAADTDQDGFVDGGDATAILKYNVGVVDSSTEKIGTYK
jgi:methionine-rich copper-binding protein CopC